MVSAGRARLSARVDITGGIGNDFQGSLREARRNIALLQTQSLQLQADFTEAETAAKSFGDGMGKDAVRNRKLISDLETQLANLTITQRQYRQAVKRAGDSTEASANNSRRALKDTANEIRRVQRRLKAAEKESKSFGGVLSKEAIEARRRVRDLRFQISLMGRELQQVTNHAAGLERLQKGFRALTGAGLGFTAGFAGLGLLANNRVNQVQELAQSQLEAGIRSSESVQRSRRAVISLGLDPFIGDELIKEIGKEGKKKAAEAVVDPGSEQAKRLRQFVPDRSPAELLAQANTDPEGYAVFVLEALQRVSTEQGPAEAGLLAEVLAGETGGDFAAGLINAGLFGQYIDVYKQATILSDEQVESTRRLVGALGQLSTSFGQWIDSIGAGLDPVLRPLLEWITSAVDWMVRLLSEHKKFSTFIAVTAVATFFAFSIAVGLLSVAFIQLWISSLLASGGVTTSGIVAAVASGGWWGLAAAVWAATWPILAIIAVVVLAVVGFYFLQKRLGGVKEAFFQLRDVAILSLSPILLLVFALVAAVGGLIRLLNLIPGVDIDTGAIDEVANILNPYKAVTRSIDRFQNPPPDSDDDEDDTPRGPGFGPSGVPLELPSFPSSAGSPTSSTGSTDNSQIDSNNQYVFNTENHFYGDTDAAQTIADDTEEKIREIVPARKFRS